MFALLIGFKKNFFNSIIIDSIWFILLGDAGLPCKVPFEVIGVTLVGEELSAAEAITAD